MKIQLFLEPENIIWRKKKISKLEKRLKKKNLEYAEYFFPL